MFERTTKGIAEKLSEMDVDRITLDEISYLLFVPRFMGNWWARLIMGTGVRQGKFSKNSDGTYRFISVDE